MMVSHVNLFRPRLWSVRARSTVASTLVVAFCLILAGVALLVVLYHSLEDSARSAAEARALQVAGQLEFDSAAQIDRSLLATDAQIGLVQIVDPSGQVLAGSAGDDTTPLSTDTVQPSTTVDLGRAELNESGDFWATGRGVSSLSGPVTVVVGADREPVESVVTTVALLLAVAGPIIVALVAFATHRLVGSALSPVERIRSHVASISTRQLDERIPVPTSNDEIARLAVTMNEMLARLQSGHLAQQRFVSDASHELRSPLSTITAALELAASRPDLLDDALIDESLLPEARRMRQLIEDLLTLARSDENAGAHAVSVDVDLDDILYSESKRVTAMSGLEVETSIVPARVTGDPTALARMVRNIVDNAVHHAHSEIALASFMSEGFATIVIDDDGPGIPPEDRPRIFDRFVRLDSSRAREHGGAGLGLAIVAGIVSAHGGIVNITERPGGGTRFRVSFPT